MTSSKMIQKWLTLARNDLLISAALNVANEVHWQGICYHLQQSVEKYLKALLTYKGVRVKKTHNIEMLLLDLDKYFPHINKSFSKLSNLTSYMVLTRYPESEEHSNLEISSNILLDYLDLTKKFEIEIRNIFESEG